MILAVPQDNFRNLVLKPHGRGPITHCKQLASISKLSIQDAVSRNHRRSLAESIARQSRADCLQADSGTKNGKSYVLLPEQFQGVSISTQSERLQMATSTIVIRTPLPETVFVYMFPKDRDSIGQGIF